MGAAAGVVSGTAWARQDARSLGVSWSRLNDRLHNWGAWARSDEDGPASSAIASFWRKWIPHKAWDPGWGDPNAADGPETGAIDVEDAEVIDGWVRQCPQTARMALVRRFVHQHRPCTPHERSAVQAAIQTLSRAMGENMATVRHMQNLLRGRR